MEQFLSSAGSSEEEEMHLSCAVLLLCPEHQCLQQAGAAASRARAGSRGQCWVPWFSRIISSQAGRLMGLLTGICNTAKNRQHNSLLCLSSAGMQQASRARDGRALILSCPILEYIKTAGRKHAEKKRVEKA